MCVWHDNTKRDAGKGVGRDVHQCKRRRQNRIMFWNPDSGFWWVMDMAVIYSG